MKIRFGWIMATVGLTLAGMAGGVFATPAGLPQQMLPSYVPAAPGRGIASFRPHYRMQPVRQLPHFVRPGVRPPVYAPLPRAAAWPIPVSYRPIAPLPTPRMPRYGYPGQGPRWAAYPLPVPVRGYGARPTPWTWYPYPPRPPVGAWGYPRPAPYRQRPAYPPVAPAFHPPPFWIPPAGAGAPPPQFGYPGRPWFRQPARPAPRAVAGPLAGRYQPYAGYPGARPDYRFRPLPQAVAFQGQPVATAYRPGPAYPWDSRFRQDPRFHPPRFHPLAGQRMPTAPYRYGQHPALGGAAYGPGRRDATRVALGWRQGY
jgi:hypothetical protein